jgi:hypothetical protein
LKGLSINENFQIRKPLSPPVPAPVIYKKIFGQS